MDKQKIIDYWLSSAQRDQEAAESLFRSAKYSWSLFIWQLVIEKHLKALIVKKLDKSAPPTHNLLKLTKVLDLQLNDQQIYNLEEITKFNIDTRYDDYKLAFYKKATKSFTIQWIKTIKKFLSWLNKQQ